MITIEKYTPRPILPEINNKPIAVSDILYLIVAVLSFIVVLTSIGLILVLLFNPPDETRFHPIFVPQFSLKTLGFLKPVKDNIDHFQSLRR